MQNQLHQETVKEIAKVKAYLGHLEAMRSFLEGGGIPAPKSAPSQPAKAKAPAKPKRKRALPGTFQATLLTLFTAGDILNNANVRDRLKAINYGPVDSMHVRKTLAKMGKAGKLTAVRQGDNVAYRLP